MAFFRRGFQGAPAKSMSLWGEEDGMERAEPSPSGGGAAERNFFRRDFALCGARPKGAALRKPATFEKVDETFICASRLSSIHIFYICSFGISRAAENRRYEGGLSKSKVNRS